MNNQPEPRLWTIINVLNWTCDFFKSKAIESPRLKTELLLCHLLKLKRIDLYSNFDKPLSQSELKLFRDWVQRAGKREPVQMIIGEVQFCDLRIKINNSSIVPRPETEQMTEIIRRLYKKTDHLKILDIGSGSGCIGLSLAKSYPDANVVCMDISDVAITLAKQNASLNNIDNVTFLTADVSKYRFLEQFDLIVSNPPYIKISEYRELEPEVREWEPREALTDEYDGLKFYKLYSELFREILTTDGNFFLETGWDQNSKVRDIFSKNGFLTISLKDFQGIERFIKGKFQT